MADLKINGYTGQRADLILPPQGRWTARVNFDGELAIGQSVALRLLGVDYVGHVVEAGSIGAAGSVMVAGGTGGLDRSVEARHYRHGPQVQTILFDVLGEVGESLSALSDSAVLARSLTAWTRTAGTALDAVDELAEYCGCKWRVLPDGSIWIGSYTWPAVTTDWTLIGGEPEVGRLTISAETATFAPGEVLDNLRLRSVTHMVTSASSRSILRLE